MFNFYRFSVHEYDTETEQYLPEYPIDLRLSLIQKIEYRDNYTVIYHSTTPHSEHYSYFKTKLTPEEHSRLMELLNE